MNYQKKLDILNRKSVRSIVVVLLFSFMILYPSHEISQEYVWAEHGTNKEYKAITYNIHHGKTKDGKPSIQEMVNLLKKENPDFIALQEVDRFSFRSGLNDQINIFAEQLDMYAVFEPNINVGVLQYGNGILSKYPILESGKIMLPSHKEPRSLLWAKVMTEKGNIYITSIHLGLAQTERKNYFHMIKEFIEEVAGDQPVLIMGDFNTLPTDEQLKQLRTNLTGNIYFSEVPTYKHHSKEIQIDYIMGKGIQEGSTYRLLSDVSDHYPLVMKFKFKDQKVPLVFNRI